jgi:zinc and cadmium transporter
MNGTTLAFYCFAALVVSLAGGTCSAWFRLTHTRLQIALSFVAGLMLGIALLHMVPHAAAETASLDRAMQWALVGFLTMFFLQRVFHYHSHDTPGQKPAGMCSAGHTHSHSHHHAEDSHEHAHGHGENEHCEHEHERPAVRPLTWLGTALGLGLHSLMDGVALAAAVAAASDQSSWVGFGAALAVILHKPFDAMAVMTLVEASGCKPKTRRLINISFALITPLGALLFALGMGNMLMANEALLGAALAFCGGGFLCVAASDLLPELHFHSHDRGRLSIALLAGIGAALLIGVFEGDDHGHSHGPAESKVPPIEVPHDSHAEPVETDHSHEPGEAHAH